jgi:2-polyprenyl-3-methyl-5-hydroxy-6-metoxy-1,4-benzoquinol methylase
LRKPRVQQLLAAIPGARLVEVGAGCLRNARHFLDAGFIVTAVDLPGMSERFANQYEAFVLAGGTVCLGPIPPGAEFDVAVCTFVIETVCQPVLRLALLRSIMSALRDDGFLILATRGPADVTTANAKGVACSDGFLTPNRTFVRSYDAEQLTRLLIAAGFDSVEILHKPDTVAPELLHAIAHKA